MNREAWLQAAVDVLRPMFSEAGYEIPATVHVSVGFPSKGSLSRKRLRVGECWKPDVSADGNSQIFINPIVSDGIKVLDILVHELIHAVLPEAGHKAPFAQAAKRLGLEGPARATQAGDALRAKLQMVIDRIGNYPHPGLNAQLLDANKQSTRLIKVVCMNPECAEPDDNGKVSPYTLRITRKWLDKPGFGAPICPNCESTMVEDVAETD